MTIYNTTHIESWERFYRSNFINSLTGSNQLILLEL